ncbi:MAG: hypothetical protein AB7L09_15585 [Nitrospira sp.]
MTKTDKEMKEQKTGMMEGKTAPLRTGRLAVRVAITQPERPP